jgi:cyclopropane fatty-acyl-phospholipid synthase-like methyltransferase
MLKEPKSISKGELYPSNFLIPSPYVNDFCEWVKSNKVQSVLDLGCGGHHKIGLTTAALGIDCIGTTIGIEEIKEYVKLYSENSAIMKHYYVAFQNWKFYNPELFPKFDIILAFEIAAGLDLNTKDVELILENLSRSLKPNGKIGLNNIKYHDKMTPMGKNREKIVSEIIKNRKVELYKNIAFICYD